MSIDFVLSIFITCTINLTIVTFEILISNNVCTFQTLAETPLFQHMLNESIKKKVCIAALPQFIIDRQ